MRTQVIIVGVALGCLCLSAIAAGDEPSSTKIQLVLMPVEGEAAPPTLTTEVEQALQITGHPVQRSAMGLEELMLAVECTSGPDDDCLKKIGSSIQAQGMILVQANKTGDTIELTMRWFDVGRGTDRARTRLTLPPGGSDRGPVLQEALKKLLSSLRAKPSKPQAAWGGLNISASVANVEISIDGQPRGAAPLRLEKLATGTYRIEARCPGYAVWHDQVEVKANALTRLMIDMVPSHLAHERKGLIESIRLPAWIASGVGLACLATGIAFGAHMQSQQNALNDIRGISVKEIQEMESLKETGERDALTANILFGIGGAALLTAIVLAIGDNYMGRPPARKNTGAAVLRVEASASSVGVTLSF
jgi:hypothetical protein